MSTFSDGDQAAPFNNGTSGSPVALTVSQALEARYACTRFRRYQEPDSDQKEDETSLAVSVASIGDPAVIAQATSALEMARRAPSGFNVQPYQLLMVTQPSQKEALAKWCLGRNADRVRDADAIALFLADREALASWQDYDRYILRRPTAKNEDTAAADSSGVEQRRRVGSPEWFQAMKVKLLVGLFSSGLTLPPFVVKPVMSGIRLAARIVSWITRSRFLFPTLSNRDTWSQKNTALVAMSYLLDCTSRGLATCPMEGYLSWGVRRALSIPRRYTIPLVVATGSPYHPHQLDDGDSDNQDDAGMSHGRGTQRSPRYPSNLVVHQDVFGNRAT